MRVFWDPTSQDVMELQRFVKTSKLETFYTIFSVWTRFLYRRGSQVILVEMI